MTAAKFTPSDPRTGEVLDPAEAALRAESIAREYVAADAAYRAAKHDADELDARRYALSVALRKVLPVEGRADGGAAWIVIAPGKPGSRRVSAAGCDAYREQLLDLDLGRMETRFRPPTISEVDAARAVLTAAGVPVSEIAPLPEPQAPSVVVVAKHGAS